MGVGPPSRTHTATIPAFPSSTSVHFRHRLRWGSWLSGQGGLFRQDLETGELLSQWTLGAELPPAPVTALAIGRVGGSGETHLLATTAGGGLLSVSAAGEIFQVLPEEPVLADLTAVLPLSTGGVLLGT